MIDFITSNILFGIILTVVLYVLTRLLYKKTKISLLNPVLLSTIIIISLLLLFNIPLENYMKGAKYISLFLPVTIILLALPLYRQLPLLKKHRLSISIGILSGVLTSFLSIIVLSKIFGVDKELIQSIIPKSITTPLGIIVSDSLDGIAGITVISIVFTGILGVVIYSPIFLLFRIKHPVAKGIALGTTSHAIGTSKALELGEIEGAMAGLAIILTGVTTVILTPLYILILTII